MELATLRAFEVEVKKHIPTFKLAFKDETPWMKVLDFFATPFNPKFMSGYTTTFGKTVYFPSRAYYENSPKSSFTVLAHEFVHMVDSDKSPGWFQFSYALPQVLAPIVLAAYTALAYRGWVSVGILALGVLLGCLAARKSVAFFMLLAIPAFVAAAFFSITFAHWWSALFFGGLALLAPLPSPWRTKWEMRGYVMSLSVMAWTFGPPPQVIKDMVAKHFYGGDYYFMSWSKASIYASFDAGLAKVKDGTLRADFPYGVVYDFLAARKELRDG